MWQVAEVLWWGWRGKGGARVEVHSWSSRPPKALYWFGIHNLSTAKLKNN